MVNGWLNRCTPGGVGRRAVAREVNQQPPSTRLECEEWTKRFLAIQAFLILRRERKNLESRSTIFGVPSARNRHRRATKLPDDSTTKATAGGCRRCNNDALWVQPDNECNVDHRHRRATFARYDPRSECRNDRQRRPSYSGYHSCRSEGNGAVRFPR